MTLMYNNNKTAHRGNMPPPDRVILITASQDSLVCLHSFGVLTSFLQSMTHTPMCPSSVIEGTHCSSLASLFQYFDASHFLRLVSCRDPTSGGSIFLLFELVVIITSTITAIIRIATRIVRKYLKLKGVQFEWLMVILFSIFL